MLYTRPQIQPLEFDLLDLRGGGSFPSQFYGRTADDRPIYIKYRGGCLIVRCGAHRSGRKAARRTAAGPDAARVRRRRRRSQPARPRARPANAGCAEAPGESPARSRGDRPLPGAWAGMAVADQRGIAGASARKLEIAAALCRNSAAGRDLDKFGAIAPDYVVDVTTTTERSMQVVNAANSASVAAACCMTGAQSPIRAWRKMRSVGYHGLSFRPLSQRQQLS